jgi:stalled ribosome rescue protein Dom34
MSSSRAVLLIDHHSAQLVPLDAPESQVRRIHEHTHQTRQHGSAVRSEHEFFAEVCEALSGVAKVLVTGSHQAQADFARYVEKHRPAIAPRIVGWETVDHPTLAQLQAQAREFFVKYELFASGPTTPV